MKRRSRLRKGFKVLVNGIPKHTVKSPEEFDKVLKKYDRRKDKVRLA